MFNKISIIGCGLIGSSILRAVEEKKLATKISAHDKSSKVIDYLKKFGYNSFFLQSKRLIPLEKLNLKTMNSFLTI